MAGIYYSMNDYYPGSSPVVQTTAETIPEEAEREHYNDTTTVNEKGKTEIVDKKSIFITLAIVVGLLFMLNGIEA
jgi:hypothetical protein